MSSVSVGTAIYSQSIFTLVRMGLADQVSRVREGLSSNCVVEMSDALAMSCATLLDTLQLSTSSVCTRIKKKKPLTLEEGSAVLRLAKALDKAEAVFENRVQACLWLKRKTRSFRGVTPVSLMDTSSGYELVMRQLGRIEHGVVA